MTTDPPPSQQYEGDFALVYDLFCPPDRLAACSSVADLVGPPPARVIDLMSGTAEMSVNLARLGYAVTAVDRSKAMLRVARTRLEDETPEVRSRVLLLAMDLTDWELPGDYDAAVALSGSWNLLAGPTARDRALRSVRASLRRGGRLLLDLFPPISETGRSEERTFAPLRQPPSGWRVSKRSFVERDAATQVVRIHEALCVNGRVSTQTLVLHLIGPDEILRELQANGFSDATVRREANQRGGDSLVVTATA